MVIIYNTDGTPLFGYVTADGESIASYGHDDAEDGGERVYRYVVDGETKYSTVEPTPAGLSVDDDSQRSAELMGDDSLTLKFSLAESVTFPLRCYCVFGGRRYFLFNTPEVTKQHDRQFDYTMPMYTNAYLLKITLMRNTVDKRLSFPLTATPREHLEMLVSNLNAAESGNGSPWSVDYSKTMGMVSSDTGAHTNYDGTAWEDNGDEQLVNYEFVYCTDALQQAADSFDTEYEIAEYTDPDTGTVGYLVSLHDVEYNKDTPLVMGYGKGNGFVSGIARKNDSDTPPLDRLYIQGGEQNIPAHYGQTPNGDGTYSTNDEDVASTTLLLPKNVICLYSNRKFYFGLNPTIRYDNGVPYIQQKDYTDPDTGLPVYEVLVDEEGDTIGYELTIGTPCFLTSSDGHSVMRVRHTYYDPSYTPRGTSVEGYYDASEIYPMRVGGVSRVQTITRTRSVDDGQGGTTTETYKLYDIIDALSDCPDYSQCSVSGETMTMIFQDGMLAGREFDLNTTEIGTVICPEVTVYDDDNNPIQARKLELCPSDIDGITMPNDTFAPAVGDHYIVFHCSLPQPYISGVAYGAEYRALREMVAYLHDHGKQTYTFTGTVQGMWAKQVWDEIVEDYDTSAYGFLQIKHSEYFAVGQHIKVSDVQLFGSDGLVMRVTGVTQHVNNPRSIELSLSNAIVLKYNWTKQLSQTVRAVRIRPRYRRPDNPLFPRHISADEVLQLNEALDDEGNLLDLRRNAVVPLSLFKDSVGLSASEGLLYSSAQHMGKINELIDSIYSANQILVSIQSNFNTLRNQLVNRQLINQDSDSGTVGELGIEQCKFDPLLGEVKCSASPSTIGVPSRLQN